MMESSSENKVSVPGTVAVGSARATGAPGRRVLVVAASRSEDRALRAMVTRLKELVPCEFEILNLESATAARYRLSSRTLFGRIRRYDAAVFALTSRDGASSSALALPTERLPLTRHFLRRIPAVYLVDGPISPGLETAIASHARAWHLLPLGTVSDDLLSSSADTSTDLPATSGNASGLSSELESLAATLSRVL
jgi:hypothetical protein